MALAHDRPNAQVTATDKSEAALAVARANAQRLSLPNVSFVVADWYAGVPAGAVGLKLPGGASIAGVGVNSTESLLYRFLFPTRPNKSIPST